MRHEAQYGVAASGGEVAGTIDAQRDLIVECLGRAATFAGRTAVWLSFRLVLFVAVAVIWQRPLSCVWWVAVPSDDDDGCVVVEVVRASVVADAGDEQAQYGFWS